MPFAFCAFDARPPEVPTPLSSKEEKAAGVSGEFSSKDKKAAGVSGEFSSKDKKAAGVSGEFSLKDKKAPSPTPKRCSPAPSKRQQAAPSSSTK
jgi:hypothetical protein